MFYRFRCIICGEPIAEDDEVFYCPECGSPMHKDCFDIEGKCPGCADKIIYSELRNSSVDTPAQNEHHFSDGSGCEICGKPFGENDEIVYCPECGTAMHRVCYNITHRCPYENEHSAMKENTADPVSRLSPGVIVCDKCGKALDNGEDKVYCPECGTPVHKSCWQNDPVCPNAHRHRSGYDWAKEHSRIEHENRTKRYDEDKDIGDFFDRFPEAVMQRPLLSHDNGEELTCMGVKQRELLHFLGINNISTPRFFSLFMKMANSRRILSINFSAWFFMPFYHFYRRMTGPGIILSILTFILMVPSLIAQAIYFASAGSFAIDSSLISAADTASYILILIRIIILLFSDYIYMRWSVSKILSLREQYKDSTEEEYYEILERRGNPKLVFILTGIGIFFILINILSLFVTGMNII